METPNHGARGTNREQCGFTKRTCENTQMDKRANHLVLTREGLIPLSPWNGRDSTSEENGMQEIYKFIFNLDLIYNCPSIEVLEPLIGRAAFYRSLLLGSLCTAHLRAIE